MARIGVVAPFSGEGFLTGYRILFSVRLAIREWNERGGVAGRWIELVALDDEGREGVGQIQARALTLDGALIGVVGHPSAPSAESAAPVYGSAGVPALLLGPVEGTYGGPIFRLAPSLESLGRAIPALIPRGHGGRQVALLWSVNDPRERQASTALLLLRRRLEEAGLAIVLQRGVTNRNEDAAATAAELSRSRADVAIFLGEADEAAALTVALKALPTPPSLLLAPWSTEPRYLSLAAGAAESVFYLSLAADPAPAGEFYERYRRLALASALDVEPGPEGALAYAATTALFQAAQATWEEGMRYGWEATAASLGRPEGFETIVGRLAFSDKGWRQPMPVFLRQVSRLRYGGVPLAETAVGP